jgi:hypothetical protein
MGVFDGTNFFLFPPQATNCDQAIRTIILSLEIFYLYMGVLAVDVHGVLGVGEAAVVHEAEEGEESPPSCVAKHDAVRLQDSFTQKNKMAAVCICKNSNYDHNMSSILVDQ